MFCENCPIKFLIELVVKILKKLGILIEKISKFVIKRRKTSIIIAFVITLLSIKFGLLEWFLKFFFGFKDFKIAEINFDIGSTLVGLITLWFIANQNKIIKEQGKILKKQAEISETQTRIMEKQNETQKFQTEFEVLRYNLDKMEGNEFYKKLLKWMRNEESNKTSPFPIPFIPYLVLSKNKLQEYIDFMQIYSETDNSGSAYILKICDGEEKTSKMKKSFAIWFNKDIGIGDPDFLTFFSKHNFINATLFTTMDESGKHIATNKVVESSAIQGFYINSFVGQIAKFVELSLNPDAKPWS